MRYVRQYSVARRGVALAAGAGIAWLAFYVAWLVLAPGGQARAEVFADTAYLLPLVVATGLAVLAARRGPAALRPFWALVALADVFWLGGAVLWTARELGHGVASVPFPWWTDAAYLASYPPMLLAVLLAFKPSLRVLRAVAALDLALVVGALALAWWFLMLRPLPLEPDVASIVGLAYPTFDLVIIAFLAATWLLPARQGTLAMKLVAAGILAGALLNGTYMRGAVDGTYPAGEWMEIGWQAEAILLALAALVSVRGLDLHPGWARFRDSRTLGTPVVVAGTLAVMLALRLADVFDGDREPSLGLAIGSIALGALLVVRLWLFTRSAPSSAPLADPATGAYDEDYFEDQLARLVARGKHFGDSFAVALVQLDHAPDGVDAESDVARTLAGVRREVDVLARVASGRFGFLLPNVASGEALAIAEALRRTVDSSARTVSIGVAVWAPDESPETVVARAEDALAAARRLGGNQVRGAADDVLLFGEHPLDAERFEALVSLARMVDGREGPDPEHSVAVASLAAEIALEMGLEAEAVSRAYVAGLLHDLGKVALPEAMLKKPGPLDEREWAEMRRHAALGAEVVEKIGAVRDAAPIIAAHHERWDGNGYPRRLQGEEIPAEARIVAVADALVAMTTERPYRSARSETSALTSIWRQSGKRYDPAVVSALLALARAGRLPSAGEQTKDVRAPGLLRLSSS